MANMEIQYCVVWNYKPRAAGLAETIEKRFSIRPTLVKGRDGVFEVTFDGELIYSKKSTGRFPDPGEVEGEVARRV